MTTSTFKNTWIWRQVLFCNVRLCERYSTCKLQQTFCILYIQYYDRRLISDNNTVVHPGEYVKFNEFMLKGPLGRQKYLKEQIKRTS